jgi:hypothetical protein
MEVSMVIICWVRSLTYELGDLNFRGVPMDLSSVRGVSGIVNGLTFGVPALII